MRSRILGLMIGLCAVGLAIGSAGERASDTSRLEAARVELGGEGLAPLFDLFIAWVGTVQHVRTLADLVIPERVEASLKDKLQPMYAGRELRQLDRLNRFDASPKVSAHIRDAVESRCRWSQRAFQPDACHACALGVLDDMERRVRGRQREFWWLIGVSAAALALLLLAAARDPARRPRVPCDGS